MRLKTEKRLSAAALTLLAAFAVSGCDNKPKAKGKGTGSETTAAGLAVLSSPGARQAADAFLKSLSEGKASPDQFTAWFKKQSSKPIALVEAEDWLAGFKGSNFIGGEETKFGNSIVLRGRAEPAKDSFALRMTKEGDAYKVDWLHRSSRMSSGIPAPSDMDLAAAQDTARNFLDILLGGDVRQAQALMTVAWKKSVSQLPPGVQPKDGFDYEPGFLTGTMRTWKRDFSGYSLSKPELNGTKDGATWIAEMDSGSQKTSYMLRAKKLDGQWLIDEFAKQ